MDIPQGLLLLLVLLAIGYGAKLLLAGRSGYRSRPDSNRRCLCPYAVDCPCNKRCGMAATWAGPSMAPL